MSTTGGVGALVEMDDTAHGGMKHPLPSGTPSLLVIFGDDPDPRTSRMVIGARIYVHGGAGLRPGDTNVPVELEFIADPDAGRALAVAHATFTLWGGRTVGRGRVVGPVSSAEVRLLL